mgnify:CR=1 FL=1
MTPWKNETGVDFEENLADYLGFIYEIELDDGMLYVGRKQFWRKRGTAWVEDTGWREYTSSSNTIKKHVERIVRRSIICVLSSKSAIRYAEAAGIILSQTYLKRDRGYNWSFDGCKGTLKLNETDVTQIGRLYERWTKD